MFYIALLAALFTWGEILADIPLFLAADHPILVRKHEKGSLRYDSFNRVLYLMEERQVKTIVETGTTRAGWSPGTFGGDGGSTIIFGEWAMKNNAALFSVDISPEAVLKAKQAVRTFGDHVQIFQNDSIAFLKDFPHQIDMLYLDSYDYDSLDPGLSQRHHLKEIEAAYPKLTDRSIVMIDDCALPYGGKGKLVIEFLRERGWQIYMSQYQVILVKSLFKKSP
jgi:hypothetical protein